jgi:hypothetical protein
MGVIEPSAQGMLPKVMPKSVDAPEPAGLVAARNAG